MNVEVLKSEKDVLEVKTDNLTAVEVLRVRLNDSGVDFAAWKRDHPTEPAVLKVENKAGAKKAVSDAIKSIKKDLEGLEKGIK